MEDEQVKSRIREMIQSNKYPSYLAISLALNLDANYVRNLFREVQVEFEMEEYTWLVENK